MSRAHNTSAARLAPLLVALAAVALAGCAQRDESGAGWTYGPTAAPAASGSPAGSGAPGASGAAASPAGGTPVAPAPSAVVSAGASLAAPASGGTARIEVRLTDALKIEPSTLNAPAGVPVTFVVTNTGATPHEFFVGDEAAQQARERAMAGATTPPPDAANLVGLAPGQTKELTITFPIAASTLAGCHVAGHYLAGMKATITVQ